VLCNRKAVFAAASVLPIMLDTAAEETPGADRLPPTAPKLQVSACAVDTAKSEAVRANPAATPITWAGQRGVLAGSLAENARVLRLPVRVPQNISLPLFKQFQRNFCPYYAASINRGLRLRKDLQPSQVCEQRFIPGGVLIQQQQNPTEILRAFYQLTPDLPTEMPPKSRRIA
jgi:hypothetical protein